MAHVFRVPMPVLLLLITGIASCVAFPQENQPVDQQDRLPTGGGSPEAAACDMVRALVRRNYQRFIASTPIVGASSKTDNDYVNHYVSLVSNTSFRSENGVVTAHDLLLRVRLRLKQVSSPVVIKFPRYSPHGVLGGSSSQHSFVDVTVADRKTGKEYTTRMLVFFREDVDQWKAYPIPHPNNGLYKAINEINAGTSSAGHGGGVRQVAIAKKFNARSMRLPPADT